MAFVCRRTVRMATIYQLKIKYYQDKLGVFAQNARLTFHLKIMNITSHGKVMTPHIQKCPHVVHFKEPHDWFETSLGHQKRYSN